MRCGDGTLYTGITKDVQARQAAHNAGKGAAYTRSRLPVRLVFRKDGLTRSIALKKEYLVKSLTRLEKQALVRKRLPFP